MKNLFHLFKIKRSALVKESVSKGTSGERAGIKTESKAYLSLPLTFDFTAYYDDNELENNAEDIPHENSPTDTEIKILCVIDEKCNEMLYSLKSQPFECCIN
jgi:hypothetical protein